MTFAAFDAGNWSDNGATGNMLTDAVHDQLMPGHSDDEFRYALAETLKGQIEKYKSTRGLTKFWFLQSGPLSEIAEHDPVLFMDLVNHLAAKLDELT